ncbi:MAG: ABC transporter permease [Planctomycetota bacterium]|jgi:putative ABC transport system permease protein
MSTLWMLVRKSLWQHRFSTAVTIVAAALGAGLVMAVFSIQSQAEDAFSGDIGFDAVYGARGSKLQLVLNTVFHLETSPGNLPWTRYKAMQAEPLVEYAIPYALGDNFKDFRVVGTTSELFTDFPYFEDDTLKFERGHRVFDDTKREAVIGATVASKLGLGRGDRFKPYHGMKTSPGQKPHNTEYVIVGVLKPTGTPVDRVLWIPIEGIFRMDGHVLRGTGEEYEPAAGVAIPDEHKEVSAVMLRFRRTVETDDGARLNTRAVANINSRVNTGSKDSTLAWPIAEVMGEIFNKLGWMSAVLRAVAVLVVFVAAAGILASLTNTMNERRREFAILRSLGARKHQVFGAIVLEAAAIAGLGGLIGFGVFTVILTVATRAVEQSTGVILQVWAWHPAFVWTPVGMVAVGALAGVFPALSAYRTEVAQNLRPAS